MAVLILMHLVVNSKSGQVINAKIKKNYLLLLFTFLAIYLQVAN